MRDENDYAGMDRQELRQNLTRVSGQLATWQFALANVRKQRNRSFLEAYSASTGRSVAEKRMDAEMGSCADQGDLFEYEGQVAFYQTLRDEIVVLLEQRQQVMMNTPDGIAMADV